MSYELSLYPINGTTISATTTSARNTTAFVRNEVSVYSVATGYYVKFGGSTVVATATPGGYDRYCAPGIYHELNTGGNQYMAVITASGSDTVHVNQWQKK